MEDKSLLANLLIILQNFETLWDIYSISKGVLYRDSTKESAKVFLEIFNTVAESYPEIRNSKVLTINSINSTEYIDELIEFLSEWTESDKIFPISSTETCIGDNEKSRLLLQSFFMCLSAYLSCKLQLKYRPVLCKSSGEGAYHQRNIKWKTRFPWQVSDQVDNNLIASLSESETVVIVGDIRRSQDLITYSTTPNSYRLNMIAFIEKVRKTVLGNMGIFDRFTGDGFICYFNEYLSQMFQKDLYKTAIKTCTYIQNDSKSFFEDWQRELQKISHDPIGLSIGIDAGKMDYSDDTMMFAIGTPAVWASRMCTAGHAGDIVLNNRPYMKISKNELDYCFDEVLGTTKTGEQFKAFKLRY